MRGPGIWSANSSARRLRSRKRSSASMVGYHQPVNQPDGHPESAPGRGRCSGGSAGYREHRGLRPHVVPSRLAGIAAVRTAAQARRKRRKAVIGREREAPMNRLPTINRFRAARNVLALLADRRLGRMRRGGTELRPAEKRPRLLPGTALCRGGSPSDRNRGTWRLGEDPQGPTSLAADRAGGGGEPRPEEGRGTDTRGPCPPGPEQADLYPTVDASGSVSRSGGAPPRGATRPWTSIPRAWTPHGRSISSAASGGRWRLPTRICRPLARVCTIPLLRSWLKSP